MILQFLQDAFFSALAAIGFASISNPPRQAFVYCGLIAAIGHATRFLLLNNGIIDIHIVLATFIAAMIIGILAVVWSPRTRVPAETYLYPALLPMIPGMYAYRAFGGLIMCLYNSNEQNFDHYFYLFANNGLTCFFILLALTIGATIPIFMLKKISFTATRSHID